MNKKILLITGLEIACDNFFHSHQKVLSSKYIVKIIPIEMVLDNYNRRVANPLSIFIYIKEFAKFVNKNQINIVLTVGPQLGFINTISSFLSFHESWHWITGLFWTNRSFPKLTISYWVDFLILCTTNKIFADSYWQKDFLKQKILFGKYLSSKIKIPTYSSITAIKNSLFNLRKEKKYYHLRKNTFLRIGYLGIISKDKGVEIIPKIAKEINNNYTKQIKFLICGPADENVGYSKRDSNSTKSKYQLQLESPYVDLRIKLYSKIDFFKEIDVLILPSKREGFGVVCIEAQAAGIPVICSDIGPLRESNTQFYNSFQCKSFQDYINAIMLLYRKEVYQGLHKNAKKTSEKYREKNFQRTLNYVYFRQ